MLVKGVDTMAGTRDRMIDAAVVLLQHRGLAAMSFSDVITASGAARGAIYHHFPRGKDQLAREAAPRHGDDVRDHLTALPDGSPHEVVEAFLAAVRPVLAESARGGGCAVAAVTVEADLTGVAAGAFTSWTDELAGKLMRAGLADDQAQEVAALLVTVLQGAHVLCRAHGDLGPFDAVTRSLLRQIPPAAPGP